MIVITTKNNFGENFAIWFLDAWEWTLQVDEIIAKFEFYLHSTNLNQSMSTIQTGQNQ